MSECLRTRLHIIPTAKYPTEMLQCFKLTRDLFLTGWAYFESSINQISSK